MAVNKFGCLGGVLIICESQISFFDYFKKDYGNIIRYYNTLEYQLDWETLLFSLQIVVKVLMHL